MTWSNGSVVFIVFGLYIAVLTVALIVLGVGIEPDRYFFLLLLPVLIMGRVRRYLMDWAPFLLLLFSYEFLRGLAPVLGAHVHYLFSIRSDSFVFSTVPTVALQSWFYDPGSPRVYDYVATVVYFMHFVTPLSFALLLWLRSYAQFKSFMAAFVLLSYAALVTYVLFPAAPPGWRLSTATSRRCTRFWRTLSRPSRRGSAFQVSTRHSIPTRWRQSLRSTPRTPL